MDMKLSVAIAAALACVALGACTDDQPVQKDRSGHKPVVDIPLIYRTASDEGDHGLEIQLTAPEAVVGGQRFKITYEVNDEKGDLRGVEIQWGDGNVWGGLPSDLVCSSRAGEEPSEGSTHERKSLSHAYRVDRSYRVTVSAYTGGCYAHWDRSSVSMEVEVIGSGVESNGPLPPKAEIGHAYYVNGNRDILVSDIGGYDEDGFVNRVDIDWGDGRTQTLEQPLARCNAVHEYPGGWFSRPVEHAYDAPGDYLVSIEVTSVGCDGGFAQADTAQRTLEFPPEQGS